MYKRLENGFYNHQTKSKANEILFGGSVQNAAMSSFQNQNTIERNFTSSAEDAVQR